MTSGNESALESRRRLAAARVVIVGVGALGCPAARALAAAGVGTLVLVDPDRVDVSNLHRQTLHTTDRIGQAKVASAATALRREFPALQLETRDVRLETHNLAQLFAGADFVIDATDGAAAKFLINDGAVLGGIPFSHAGILGFLGQTMTVVPGRSACCRCLFPEPPSDDEVVSCRDAGVIGPLAGAVGAIQAGEAIKHLTGQGEPLLDRLLTIDARTGRWRLVRLARNPRCPACGPAAARRLDAANPAR